MERSQFGVKWLWVKGVEAAVGVPVGRVRRAGGGGGGLSFGFELFVGIPVWCDDW